VDPVRILQWPAERAAVAGLAATGVPRLLVVETGSEPPVGADCCQDWMWRGGGHDELRLRLRQLTLRAMEHGHGRPKLDGFGILHVGLRSVPLPPKEQALARVLLQHFNQAVPREALVRAAWPQGIARESTLGQRISKLRGRLSWLGLEIIVLTDGRYALRAQRGTDGDGRSDTAYGFEATPDTLPLDEL
jgi:hypothetical protein